jgi:hypothetical protein
VIKDGIDVRTVTGTTRVIRDRINIALLVRDRHCVVPTCGKRLGLERDHCQVDYAADGPTEMANFGPPVPGVPQPQDQRRLEGRRRAGALDVGPANQALRAPAVSTGSGSSPWPEPRRSGTNR